MEVMNKKVIEVLEEGISFEEVPTLTNLKKMEELVVNSDMEEKVKDKFLKRIKEIRSDSIKHSSVFNQMLEEVEQDE